MKTIFKNLLKSQLIVPLIIVVHKNIPLNTPYELTPTREHVNFLNPQECSTLVMIHICIYRFPISILLSPRQIFVSAFCRTLGGDEWFSTCFMYGCFTLTNFLNNEENFDKKIKNNEENAP